MTLSVLVTLCLFIYSVQAQVPRCPQGWVPYGNNCYMFSTAKWNWAESNSICAGRSGALATIVDKPEADFLVAEVKKRQNDYWVGLNDKGKENVFVWSDPKIPYDAKILPWNKGQPDNYNKNEHCVHFWPGGTLNDADCGMTARYICKRALYIADKCDLASGWHPLGTFCYKLFETEQTWQDSQQTCQENDGNLFTIQDMNEKRFLTETLSCPEANTNNIWIGLSDRIDRTSYKWLDNTIPSPSLTNWDTGMPKATSEQGDNCVVVQAVNNYKWRTETCGKERKFICERPQGKCPRGWRVWFGRCYQINAGNRRKTWNDAVNYCTSIGAGLITMDTNGEKSYIANKLAPELRSSGLRSVWIGVSDQIKDGTFTLWNGNKPIFTSWANNYPKDNKNMSDCAIYQTNNKKGTWISDYCFVKKGFVCEMEIHAQLIPPATPTPSMYSCAKDWKLFNGSCYWFNSDEKSWDDADSACRDQNALLASVSTPEEQSFMSVNIKEATWFGLNDKSIKNRFTFVDGTYFEPDSFMNWGFGEPNGDSEHCVELHGPGGTVGTWNDLSCTDLRDFVCKKPATIGVPPTTLAPTTRPWSPLCGPYWLYDPSNDNCYLISDDFLSWSESSLSCQTQGGELLSINTPHEQTFMTGIMLTYVVSAGNFWIGGNDLSKEGGWSWSDDSPFRYLNWYPGEPNGYGGGEDCVVISPSRQGRWNDEKCFNKFRYICEKPTNAPTPSTEPFATSITPTDCQPQMMISGDHWIADDKLTASSQYNNAHGPMNSRLDFTVAGVNAPIKMNTKDETNYTPVKGLDLKGSTYLTFSFKGCSDAHINLMADEDSTDRNTYEIVIGGWGNTKSAINDRIQGVPRVQVNTKDIVNCNSERLFWISWRGAYIKVGTGNNVGVLNSIFMSWQDPTPYAVGAVSIYTGMGIAGSWTINNPHGGRTGAWSAKNSQKGEWIQADFTVPIVVKNIVTQGRGDMDQWVSSYLLQYKYDDTCKWTMYQDPVGTNKLFQANSDRNTKVQQNLTYPFEARYIRLWPQTWANHVSLRWDVMGCIADSECVGEYMVNGDIKADASALTASGSQNANTKPENGRINSAGSWSSSAINTNQYIQVDLGQDLRIRGIVTQGRSDLPEWVTTYKVSYWRSDEKIPTYYQEPYGKVKAFIGNKDQNSSVVNMFTSPFTARYVRILPMTWSSHISLRFDVIGCTLGCHSIALIDGRHKVLDSQITASSQSSAAQNPSRSRLNTRLEGSLRGAWSPKTDSVTEWIQVDFEVSLYITGVATQGRYDFDSWLKHYYLSLSTDGQTWYTYQEGGKRKIFEGNYDRNTVRKYLLKEPFTARYVRLNPWTYIKYMSLRWEVYGCQGIQSQGAQKNMIGCYEDVRNSHDLPYAQWVPTFTLWPIACIKHCFENGYMYAGVQNEKYCYCGNSYGKYGQSNRCTNPCKNTANKVGVCGGSYANTIYSTGIAPTSLRCEDGWSPNGDNCYMVVSDPLQSWRDARDYCRAAGGDLASVLTPVEHSFVTSLIVGAKSSLWIGLNDLYHSMFFEWSDGTPVTLTRWNANEPNNWQGKKEDCVQVIKENGLWNDEHCDTRLAAICKKPKMVLPPATVPPSLPGCDQGWLPYTHSCYLFSNFRRNWDWARHFCSSLGGSLVRVDDAFEQAFLSSQLGSATPQYWTDLTDNYVKGTYTFSDQTLAVRYTNWNKDQPDNSIGQCVAMGTGDAAGLWTDSDCSNRYHSVCEKLRTGYTNPPAVTHIITPPPCPGGWIAVGDYCFQINKPDNTDLQKTWVQARDDCRMQGGDLASFHNATEHETVWRKNILYQGSRISYWIGFNTRDRKKGYVWTDGSASQYTNWNDNEPNNHMNQEDCAEMDVWNGKWNDNNCGNKRNWICKLSRDRSLIVTSPATAAPTAGPEGSCAPDNDDWKFFGGKCYLFADGQGDTKKSWRQANQYCMDNGGYLASILNQDTQNFVQAQVKTLDLNSWQVWIGLNEIAVGDGHRWADGAPLTYVNWARMEPNDMGGGEACGGMFKETGKWNDEHCAYRTGFVCEKFKGASRITVGPTQPLPGYCPAGYQTFGNKCYKIFASGWSDYQNWDTANKKCRENGDVLASIRSQEENDFLTSKLLGINKNVWIGMKIIRDSTYMWINNDDVTYTNWDQGEPSSDKEECVEMKVGGNHHAGRWNDNSCYSYRGYVCMTYKKADIFTPGPTVNSCGSGWVPYGDGCYYFMSAASTWNQAKSTCASQQSNLVTITSQYEQSFIRSWTNQMATAQSVWLGLSDIAKKGSYNWVDNWPVIYTNWGTNEPSREDGEGCVSFNVTTGSWTDDLCTKQLPAICKRLPDSVTPPFTQVPPNGRCPDDGNNWVPLNSAGSCYLFMTNDVTSFADASLQCSTHSSELISIHSDDESEFLSTYMKQQTGRSSWTGLLKNRNGGFVWKDGSPTQYTNWRKGEPNDVNGEGSENCVEVNYDGTWNDANCDTLRGYICQVKMVFSIGGTTPPDIGPPKTTVATSRIHSSPITVPPTTNQPIGSTSQTLPSQSTIPSSSMGMNSQNPVTPPATPSITDTPGDPGSRTGSGGTAQPVIQEDGNDVANAFKILGIVVACLAAVGIVGGAVFMWRRRRGKSNFANGFDNALYNPSENSVQVNTSIDYETTNGGHNGGTNGIAGNKSFENPGYETGLSQSEA